MAANWRELALCKNDPDLWWDDSKFREALHQCLVHCPVLFKCQDVAFKSKPAGGVMGGIKWVHSYGSSLVGRPGKYAGPVPCDECTEKTDRPCGYCGERTNAPIRATGHFAHPGCHDDYVKYVQEITLILNDTEQRVCV